ncbi:hypothetical protein MMC11_005670 [Xylographa trunciseda]|nr:hypothetical protein [Xylographa trunciseda]
MFDLERWPGLKQRDLERCLDLERLDLERQDLERRLDLERLDLERGLEFEQLELERWLELELEQLDLDRWLELEQLDLERQDLKRRLELDSFELDLLLLKFLEKLVYETEDVISTYTQLRWAFESAVVVAFSVLPGHGMPTELNSSLDFHFDDIFHEYPTVPNENYELYFEDSLDDHPGIDSAYPVPISNSTRILWRSTSLLPAASVEASTESAAEWLLSESFHQFPGNIDQDQALQPGPSLVRETTLAIGLPSLSDHQDFLPQGRPIVQGSSVMTGWDTRFQDPTAASKVQVSSRFPSSDSSLGGSQSNPLPDSPKGLTDKPSRPRLYLCPVSGCANRPGFTSKGDMQRHHREIHENGGLKTFPCLHHGCNRGARKPFKRKENLKEHKRRVHPSEKAFIDNSKTQSPLATPTVQRSVPHPSLSESFGLEEESLSLPMERKKRRLVQEHRETRMRADFNATDDLEASHNRGAVANRQINLSGFATDVHENQNTQIKQLKQQLASKETELKAVIAEKDAQIDLLKVMLQDAYRKQA